MRCIDKIGVMTYEPRRTLDRELIFREERIYALRMEGKLVRRSRRFRLIDAFAGAGGMTLGFSETFGHSFDSVWANDFNEHCVETYNVNFGKHCLTRID